MDSGKDHVLGYKTTFYNIQHMLVGKFLPSARSFSSVFLATVVMSPAKVAIFKAEKLGQSKSANNSLTVTQLGNLSPIDLHEKKHLI